LRRRSNLLVLLGLASFVLGLLAVYLFTNDEDSGTSGDSDTVEVVAAATDLEAGTSGDEILSNNSYTLKRISRADLTADNVVAQSQLSGTVLTLRFAEGEPLRISGLRSLGNAVRAQIPEGFEAVAIRTTFVAGGAATIAPNDLVNIYINLATVSTGSTTSGATGEAAESPTFAVPRTELLLANVKVLDVQSGTSPLAVGSSAETSTATGAATPNELIFVLALDTVDAEKVIFGSTTGQLYLSRVRLDDAGNGPDPVDTTPGRDFLNILSEEAQQALNQSTPTP
jgi:Flp pilus assembly protein CpaB